jgi:colanic acid biosynthesis glycosyl transferase WcaI
LHVQDIEFGAAVRLGLIRHRTVQRAVLALYRRTVRGFDSVSTISRTMAGELRQLGASTVDQFPNWVDVQAIRPGVDTAALRRELALPEHAAIALYSGNLGSKQGVETLLEAARRLERRTDIHFLICGAGSERAPIEAAAAKLANVSVRPLQAQERLNELLNLADIHLLPQRRGNTLFAMPSKLGGMLASGRAVVAQADDDSEFARMLADCALVVPAEDAQATAAAIRTLADDPERRALLGERGRCLAVDNFSRDEVLGRFLEGVRRGREYRTVSPAIHRERTADAD